MSDAWMNVKLVTFTAAQVSGKSVDEPDAVHQNAPRVRYPSGTDTKTISDPVGAGISLTRP
ncbi:MAG: hypothetical protein U0163_07555 [Gemmatimonadaceae bacterium]